MAGLYIIIITLLLIVGFFIAKSLPYKPGDSVGYNMGLVGGLMLLSLLLYPLRKRVRFLKNFAPLPKWFKWHMVFGILGPTLILFHSTFHIGSLNAGVALACMLLVSGSGIFGRFFYTKIHYGLYGRHATHKQLQEDLDGSDVQSIFNFAPEIQKKLVEFHGYGMNSYGASKIRIGKLLTLSLRAKWLSIILIRDLEDAMYGDANEKKWNDVQMQRLDELFYQNVNFIHSYLRAVKRVAQFGTYERLFSLWHVIAVHMY